MTHFYRRIKRQIFRERRRFSILGTVLFVFGVFLMDHWDTSIHGVPLGLIGAVIFTLIALSIALVFVLILPGLRSQLEISMVALMLLEGSATTFHTIGDIYYSWSEWSKILAFFIVAWIVSQIYCGTWLKSWKAKYPTARYTCTSRLPVETLWHGLVGDPNHPERLHNRDDLIDFSYLEPGKHDRRMIDRLEGGGRLEEHQFVEEIDAPHYIRFRWHAVDEGPDDGFTRGIKTCRIYPDGNKTRIDITTSPAAYPWNLVLFQWVDDFMGRLGDDYLDTLERRGETPEPDQPHYAYG